MWGLENVRKTYAPGTGFFAARRTRRNILVYQIHNVTRVSTTSRGAGKGVTMTVNTIFSHCLTGRCGCDLDLDDNWKNCF
jgi:hypothetical protein